MSRRGEKRAHCASSSTHTLSLLPPSLAVTAGMDCRQSTHTLAAAFNSLADEVQLLADRKTVLEHKLFFAHEQFQYLAEKYAPSTPEIVETLAKLHLPPHTSVDQTLVPLPQRSLSSPQPQHQLALVIRDGRRAASRLVSLAESSKTTVSSREATSHTSRRQTSMSTTLEKDFTVEGKKGNLQCPFRATPCVGDGDFQPQALEMYPHASEDPLRAAMSAESTSQPAASGTAVSKCPIRFMDRHSAAEIAHYVETHKHELPRSHEVCLRRYQKNEEQIRKLDSKYGNIVSMIEDLGQLHQPMLPEEQGALPRQIDVDRTSIERVETWAQGVSVTVQSEVYDRPTRELSERQGHFDRQLKEVRVGESPSRPWGISIPVCETASHAECSVSPPAPVRMPRSRQHGQSFSEGRKCPLDQSKTADVGGSTRLPECDGENLRSASNSDEAPDTRTHQRTGLSSPLPQTRPAFFSAETLKVEAGSARHMIFTGPVFIGYPMDQAVQFLNQHGGIS